MIIVNFKTYPESSGENVLKLANICRQVALETNLEIIIGLQAVDINKVSSQVDIPVFCQHIDPFTPGRHTGFVLASAVKQAGAKGVFLNHSEHKYQDFAKLEQAVKQAKDNGLKVLIFAENRDNSLLVDMFNPDYIALEEPDLVSGDKAMVEFDHLKEEIQKFSQSIKSVPLIGAGIKTVDDVKQSLSLGVKGVALASGVIKAKDPKAVLHSLALGF
jgi:triosephosphate isomerase (TIM)